MKKLVHYIKRKRIRLVYLIIGLVAVSASATTIIQIASSYRSEVAILSETTLSLNNESALKMSSTMDALFAAMKQSQGAMAYFFSEKALKGSGTQEHLDVFLKSSHYFNSLVLVDQNGQISTVAPSSLGLAGHPVTSAATKTALALKKPYVSNPYWGTTNRLLVLISEPIFDSSGQYRGFIGGTIYLQEGNVLNDIFGKEYSSEMGSYAYVVDAEGNLIYHPDAKRLGENVSKNLVVQQLMQGREGSEIVTNTRGIRYLAGYATAKQNGWGIVIQTPYEEIQTNARTILKHQITFSLPLFAILLVLAVGLARKLSVPFTILSEVAQQISAGRRIEAPPFSSHWNHEVHQLNTTIMLAFQELQGQADEFAAQAQTDPLTGLTNRRTMNAYTQSWSESQVPFALLALDIDRFKDINDTYGHQAGDEVLKHLAAIMMAEVRSCDICCRFGGEEFVILLPRVSLEEAYQTAERIRKHLECAVNPAGKQVTVSIGIAICPEHTDNVQQLFDYADQSLYAAKKDGRNQTRVYQKEC